MLFTKKITLLLLTVLIGSSGLFAQTVQKEDVTDEKLEQWAAAYKQIQLVDQEAQQHMITAVEESGMEVPRFIELQQAQADPDQELEAESEEVAMFTAASQKIQQIQTEAQTTMQTKIQEKGMTLNEYQELGAVIQSDQELQAKMMEYLQAEE
jgi:hypothetical protein